MGRLPLVAHTERVNVHDTWPCAETLSRLWHNYWKFAFSDGKIIYTFVDMDHLGYELISRRGKQQNNTYSLHKVTEGTVWVCPFQEVRDYSISPCEVFLMLTTANSCRLYRKSSILSPAQSEKNIFLTNPVQGLLWSLLAWGEELMKLFEHPGNACWTIHN